MFPPFRLISAVKLVGGKTCATNCPTRPCTAKPAQKWEDVEVRGRDKVTSLRHEPLGVWSTCL